MFLFSRRFVAPHLISNIPRGYANKDRASVGENSFLCVHVVKAKLLLSLYSAENERTHKRLRDAFISDSGSEANLAQ